MHMQHATHKLTRYQFIFYYSDCAITVLIALKLCLISGTHLTAYLHASQLGNYCMSKGRSQILRSPEPIGLKLGTAKVTSNVQAVYYRAQEWLD